MDLPEWSVLALTIVAIVLVLAFGIVMDLMFRRPNLLITGVSVIAILMFTGGMFWLSVRDRLLRRRILAQVSTAYKLMGLMPDEMEDVATELFRLQGYVVTENKRPDLEDGGVDFEIVKHGKTRLVQVKHWHKEVGVREARELWGLVASEGAEGGILIGTSGFSEAAREFAEGKDLQLIDGSEFMHLRSQLNDLHATANGVADPLVSEGFARYFATLSRPACPNCQKPMVLVTRLEDTAISYQLWGCRSIPKCSGTRRFVFTYQPGNPRQTSVDAVKG
ncbi:MAG: restriction endonuclease [Thermoanaerobaculales bacterium]